LIQKFKGIQKPFEFEFGKSNWKKKKNSFSPPIPAFGLLAIFLSSARSISPSLLLARAAQLGLLSFSR
jgi:hypothetical protein